MSAWKETQRGSCVCNPETLRSPRPHAHFREWLWSWVKRSLTEKKGEVMFTIVAAAEYDGMILDIQSFETEDEAWAYADAHQVVCGHDVRWEDESMYVGMWW